MTSTAAYHDYVCASANLGTSLIDVDDYVHPSASTISESPRIIYIGESHSTSNMVKAGLETNIAGINSYFCTVVNHISPKNNMESEPNLQINAFSVEHDRFFTIISSYYKRASQQLTLRYQESHGIKAIKGYFSSPNWEDVDAYLNRNDFLVFFLNRLIDEISRYDHITGCTLEYCFDEGERWERLYIAASNDIEDIDLVCELEEEIFSELFQPHFLGLQGKIVFSLV